MTAPWPKRATSWAIWASVMLGRQHVSIERPILPSLWEGYVQQLYSPFLDLLPTTIVLRGGRDIRVSCELPNRADVGPEVEHQAPHLVA